MATASGTGRADVVLDRKQVTAQALSRDWGIKAARILASYKRHHPETREALRAAIQYDLTHRQFRAPPHAGSLVWGSKGKDRSDFPKSLNCEALRAKLLAVGAHLPE